MTLTERINQDLKLAMKSGDQVRLTTIRSIRAALIDFSKRGSDAPLTPDDETTLLLAASKKRKEAIEMYEKGGRKDLSDQERRELEIITEYLPKQMTREDAEAVVVRLVAETGAVGAKDFSKVMPLAMKELKGKIDGKIVQEIVRQKIGE
jgi:uncharacterized protein YqeY